MEPTPNARTIESYEAIVDEYARQTAGATRVLGDGLTALIASTPLGHVLEIGSGPGWDADLLEEAGLTVRRTDVTQGFIDFQRRRGKEIARLDAINDSLGGPYDAVVALHVLQHIEPIELGAVMTKIAEALRPGGHFLVSIPVGEGTGWETGESGRSYYRALRTEPELSSALTGAGLRPQQVERSAHTDGWLCVLASAT